MLMLDPVTFLLQEPDVAHNFLYREVRKQRTAALVLVHFRSKNNDHFTKTGSGQTSIKTQKESGGVVFLQPEKGSVVQAFFKYFVATELHVGTLLVHAHTHTRTHRHVFIMHTCTHTCTQTDSSSEWVDPLGGRAASA